MAGLKGSPLKLTKKKKETAAEEVWKVLVVDDEKEIHALTANVFSQFRLLGKGIECLNAYSGREAQELMRQHSDIAVVLLDVVMESNHAGLETVRFIREELKNPWVRIILRTGQPGEAPEKEIFEQYDINDYKLKSELTEDKLYISLLSTIRTYQGLKTIETISMEKGRLDAELKTAAAVQQALFPKSLPNEENMEFASYFQYASETGGDWYGFMTHLENHLYILIGDVTGHGTPAALVTATVSASSRFLESIHTYHREENLYMRPSEFLRDLNRNVFLAGFPDFQMTFFVAKLNLKTGMMSFSNAGHNHPKIVHTDGEIQYLFNRNNRLGEVENAEFTEAEIQLKTDDLLFFYTDGLIENGNADREMWGEHRLRHYLTNHHQKPIQQLVDDLIQETTDFAQGHPIDDDVTLVAFKVTAPFPAGGTPQSSPSDN